MKASLASIGVEPNDYFIMIENIRKYKDAIQWSSKEEEWNLPPSFMMQWTNICVVTKKKLVAAKRGESLTNKMLIQYLGNFFGLFLGSALDDGNTFAGVYKFLQWYFKARLVNIRNFCYHHTKSISDLLKLYNTKQKLIK